MKTTKRMVGVLVGVCLAVVAGSAFAATVPYTFKGLNVTREGGATYFRGTSPSEVAAAGVTSANRILSTNGSANWYQGTGALLQNGGVVFNAAVPIAAGAASVAVTAIRLNPAGLLTSAAISWLASSGLSYVDGQFKKSTQSWAGDPAAPTPGLEWAGCSGWGTYEGQKSCLLGLNAVLGNVYWKAPFPPAGCNPCTVTMNYGGSNSTTTYQITGRVPPGGLVVAQEADFTGIKASQTPDAVIMDMIKAGIPLPTDKSVFTPPYKDVAVSDPVVDPVTGKRTQDMARVTPQPSAPDTASIQMVKQEVDAQGVPVVNPATNTPVAPAEEKDPCKLNPDASACKPLDDVSDSDLLTGEISLSLSPISGFGPDSGTCPAPQTLMTKGGVPVVWSWQMYCDFASGIRPLIVGFAWLAALMIVIGVARRNG